jgi:hypothetical protein
MRIKNSILLLLGLFILPLVISCDKTKEVISYEEDTTDDQTETIDTADFEGSVSDALAANCGNHEDADDYTWDNADVVYIILNGNSIAVDGTGATVSGSMVTITSAGTYSISGSLIDGQVIVNTEDENVVRLILNGVDINCSANTPLYIVDADKAVIILAENTQNYLIDGNTYIFDSTYEDQPNAAIFSMADLSIYGNGELTVEANYADGIASKDGLIINSGTISVNSADDGIRGKDYLIIDNGNITINSMGDGLKSDNENDSTKGYIYIKSGRINITSEGDAIAGQTDVLISDGEFNLTSGGGNTYSVDASSSAKGLKGQVNVIIEGGTINVNSADDAIHSHGNVVINSGTLNLSTADDGIHSEGVITINGDELYITKSYEGIEGSAITVNYGIVSIVASDDGFNASKGNGGETNDGSNLYLKGGTIIVNASRGDGLDSNGNITIAGGTCIVHGPQSQPEVGMDYNGTCNITGGFLIISGTNSNMTQGPSTSSTQYSLKFIAASNIAAGSLFHIEDANGTTLVTFKPVRSYYSIVFSSPELQYGTTYHIYTGGSSTGNVTNGLYTGGEYSPGTEYGIFTISSILTSIGSGTGGGGGGPGGW